MNLYKEFATKEKKRKTLNDNIEHELQTIQREKLECEAKRLEDLAAFNAAQPPAPAPAPTITSVSEVKTKSHAKKPSTKKRPSSGSVKKKSDSDGVLVTELDPATSSNTEHDMTTTLKQKDEVSGKKEDKKRPSSSSSAAAAVKKPKKVQKKAYDASLDGMLVEESLIDKVRTPVVTAPTMTPADRSMNVVNKCHMDELCQKIVAGTLDTVKEHCVMYWKIFRARNMRKIISLWSTMNARSCLRCHPSTDAKDGQGIQSILYNMRDNTMMISLFDEKYIQTNQLYYCSHTLNIAIFSNQVQVHLSSKKDDNEFVLVWIVLKQYSNRLCVLCVDKNNNIVDSINTVVYNSNEFGTDLITTPLNTLTQYVSRIAPSNRAMSTTCLISMRTVSKDINSRLRTLEQGNIQTIYFALKEGPGKCVKFDIYGVSQDYNSLHTIIFNDGQIKYIMCPSRAPESDNEFSTKLFEVLPMKHLNYVLSLLPFAIKSIVTFINMSIAQEVLMSIKYNVIDASALDTLVKYFAQTDEAQKPYDLQLVREMIKKVVDIYLCLTYEIVDLGTFHYIIRHAVL